MVSTISSSLLWVNIIPTFTLLLMKEQADAEIMVSELILERKVRVQLKRK